MTIHITVKNRGRENYAKQLPQKGALYPHVPIPYIDVDVCHGV